MTDRRWRTDDGLDPPDWVNAGRRPARQTAPAGRAPRSRPGAVPPPSPPDPRFPPDRTPPAAAGYDLDVHDVELEIDDVDYDDGDGDHGDPGATRADRRAAEQAERADRKRRRRRNLAALAIVLALVLPFVATGGWFVYQLNPPGSPGDTVEIEIEDGWGISEIGDALQREGVIGSSLAFQIYTRARSAGPFPEGRYELNTNLGVREAASALTAGPVGGAAEDLELRLPPGLTLEQIANRVGELPGRDADTFLEHAQSGVVRSQYQPPEVDSLEGLLFPATYMVGNQEDNEEDELAILQKLVAEFDERAAAAGVDNAPAAIGRAPYEAIVIASLIEREAGVEEDRPLISAVIANRLRDGDLLQIDAANCYGKGGCDDSPLTDADKENDESGYNTYRFPGLVPTPISSVGEAALRAATTPADVPFKFYVIADESGAHAFAVTFEEHEENVAAARQRGLL